MSDLTAQAVAQMQSDLEISERNNDSLRNQLGLVTADRDRLRMELSTMRQERDDALMVSTQVRTILEHTSLGLVQGINKLNDQQAQQRISRRKRQEQAFDDEFGEQSPAFLRRPTPEPAAHYDAPAQEPVPRPHASEERPDPRAFRRAPIERQPLVLRSEAVPVRPMPQRMSHLDDHPYHDDPRMPRVDPLEPGPHDPTPRQLDERNLHALADSLGVKR